MTSVKVNHMGVTAEDSRIFTMSQLIGLTGMTHKKLAGLMGVSENTISSWASGRQLPRVIHFMKLMRLIGLRMDHIEIIETEDIVPGGETR